jgi:lipopolysaccharide/colanic/teichoic acid biosynthesis glycosyltransferase
MKESMHTGVDGYLRRRDTVLARGLRFVSPKFGREYRQSLSKKINDKALALPLAAVSIPLVAGFAVAVKAENDGNAFYAQNRVTPADKPLTVHKIRSMRPGSDKDNDGNRKNVGRFGIAEDPRSSRLGNFMRKHGIDELPQLFQAIRGDMSLVGFRANVPMVFEHMKETRPETYESWHKAYMANNPASINMIRALEPRVRTDGTRYHLEMFYDKKASLGFDMYLIYKTLKAVLKP